MLVRWHVSERFSELSARETLPCRCPQLACDGTAVLSQTLQARSSGGGETAVFYLADPTAVGFLDAFFPTAGSREASFSGAWMASQSEDVSTRGLMLSRVVDGGNGLQLFDALRSDIPTRMLSCRPRCLCLALSRC
jgi:hypothetical protein